MKTLIVYYSLEGNTKYVAEKIAEKIDADILCLEPEKAYPTGKMTKYFWGGKSAVMGETPQLKPYAVELSKYERIIFGTPVWASTFTPPLRSFIRKHKMDLREKKVAFFACSGGGSAAKSFENLKGELECANVQESLWLIEPANKKKESDTLAIAEFCERLLVADN